MKEYRRNLVIVGGLLSQVGHITSLFLRLCDTSTESKGSVPLRICAKEEFLKQPIASCASLFGAGCVPPQYNPKYNNPQNIAPPGGFVSETKYNPSPLLGEAPTGQRPAMRDGEVTNIPFCGSFFICHELTVLVKEAVILLEKMIGSRCDFAEKF